MNNSSEATFLGHPKGLFVLFFAEMWERFSFYGMRALLVLYMTGALMYGEDHAYSTYGAYLGLVYATPLLGGMLADRLLGSRKAIVIGGCLMIMGHFAMAIETKFFFYAALSLIVAGNGFFKPNISTIVGSLYAQDDPRRDSAFTIFYMGINLGAMLAPLVCGIIGQTYGWGWGFSLAGVGMVFGQLVFLWGKRWLGDAGLPPNPEKLKEPVLGFLPKSWLVYLGIVCFVPLCAYMLIHPLGVEHWMLKVLGPIVGLYMLFEIARAKPGERGKIVVILVLICFSITFWACFEQAGSSMTVFTDKHVDKTVLGWEVPASVFQSINPFFILMLAPLFSWLWVALGRANKNPSSPLKFSLGLFQLALGFVMMVIGAKSASNGGLSSIWWVILAYFFHTTGELCLSPVGLSAVTRLAPARLVGLMMGMWFMSNAFAGVLSGVIAKLTTGDEGFEGTFQLIVYVGGGAGAALLILYPLLKRLEQKKNDVLAT